MSIELYPEQQLGYDAVQEWWRSLNWEENELDNTKVLTNDSTQVFRLFGYAGTGKTTIIHVLIEDLKVKVCSAAFTGKAALVMTRNGLEATTVHSLIYKPVFPDKAEVKHLRGLIKEAVEGKQPQEKIKKLRQALKGANEISFVANDESTLLDADLLVLDECSMIDDEMAEDLLAFGKPVLVLGDPGQLPPISGAGALTNDKPDILLEKIHRQAEDNPIIKMSMQARAGVSIPHSNLGNTKHISKFDLKPEDVLAVDQILVGKNKTRFEWNMRIRSFLGFEGPYPVPGDKLICLRNNMKKKLFNGLLCTVVKVGEDYPTYINYEILTEDDQTMHVDILRCHFDEYRAPGVVKTMQWWDKQEAEEFDYGYAITVHKSQGSQWDDVLFYDDKFFVWDKANRKRWLYTGITRAANTLLLVS